MNEIKTLEITHPNLAKEWHPTKNGNLKPGDVTYGSRQKVWWFLPYVDPQTGNRFNFEWEAIIANRARGCGCPFLTGNAVFPGFNDLNTTHPDIAQQWHPTRNKNLTPARISPGSNKIVWWYLQYSDPLTKIVFDFEWQDSVHHRVIGRNCPYLSGKKVFPGFNDLATRFPDIAAEWHPVKNGKLKPNDTLPGTHKKVWWLLTYFDEQTSKMFNFEWQASPNARTTHNEGCPYLSGKKVFKGFNDLQTLYPKLSTEWHPTKNGNLKPCDVTPSSNKNVWWLIKYKKDTNGPVFMLEWQSTIYNRTQLHADCPYLSTPVKKILKGFNDLATTHPDLVKEWHPTKNQNVKPENISSGSTQSVWWQIVHDDKVYEWKASVISRAIHGAGCPEFSGSNLEKLARSTLSGMQIQFQSEQSFSEFKTDKNGSYRFDFFLPSHNLLIECDGKQHFEAIGFFENSNNFAYRVQSDNQKNQYALTKNICLLRIPYVCFQDRAKLNHIIQHTITTRTIPQEIIDFYSQFEFSNYIQCVKEYESQYKAES